MAEVRRFVCNEGFGSFDSQFSTGVEIKVGPSKRNGYFASHTCDASLKWKDHELQVVHNALQVDIDVLGADLGLGAPVVGFQTRDSSRETGMTYLLYSLAAPPRLLWTITGGSYYDTKDIKLEDRNEIWTDEAAAVDGFENLPLSAYDFAPTIVLRFEKRRLIDVSSEFQAFFDHQIAEIKNQLDTNALQEFKRSDGRLSSISPAILGDLHLLKSTKAKVLEIVWSYLYSGREDEAWNVLSEMWPSGDSARIRTALEGLRSRGLLRQLDGNAKGQPHPAWKHHAVVFDMVTVTHKILDDKTNVVSAAEDPTLISSDRIGVPTDRTVDSPPKAIYLGLAVLRNGQQPLPDGKVYLNMVIDAAGKVRSAQLENPEKRESVGAAEIAASASWNFIPAFKSGRAVACRIRMGVSPQQ